MSAMLAFFGKMWRQRFQAEGREAALRSENEVMEQRIVALETEGRLKNIEIMFLRGWIRSFLWPEPDEEQGAGGGGEDSGSSHSDDGDGDENDDGGNSHGQQFVPLTDGDGNPAEPDILKQQLQEAMEQNMDSTTKVNEALVEIDSLTEQLEQAIQQRDEVVRQREVEMADASELRAELEKLKEEGVDDEDNALWDRHRRAAGINESDGGYAEE